MAETRRPSVDIPLSKTLVALQRVRSLRDPSTNSTSKFTIAIDNMRMDNSCSGACLDIGELENGVVQNYLEPEHISKIINKENKFSKKSPIMELKCSRSKRADLVLQSSQDGTNESLEITGAHPCTNLLEEDVDSCSGTNVAAAESVTSTIEKKKPRYCGWRRTLNVIDGMGISRAGSPCLSLSELCTSRSTLGLSDDAGDVNSNYSGCGISYYWSKTPKHKDPTLSSDIEGQELPLLSADWGYKSYRGIVSIPESSRSLSQKFGPRSFSDLVGLSVVTKSLTHAISMGNVAPLYLFYGPRGTGKTSTARIFAAALNCLSLMDHKPCGICEECKFLFSGRSRDLKELYATKLNHKDQIKALLKSASRVPFTSQFKVYIIEDCHFLRNEIWSTILNNIEEISKHTIFVMISSNPDKLPKSSISQFQRYHFPKLKDEDIIWKLQKICLEEGFLFEKDALSFISSKADGSLQVAETILDQLALLGKKITLSLTHELMGVVSDEELLDLLDLAFSADTRNTVRRARELMMSRIDPMQLVAQLANLIMDILSGRCQSEFSNAFRKILGEHVVAQAGIEKLRHALKVLSETEKQLRTSKNQATWLTVALLQLSTEESSPNDVHVPIECSQETMLREHEVLDSSSSRAIQENFICYGCNKLNCSGNHCNREKLDIIWRNTMALFQSGALRSFLLKEGTLSALHFSKGLAVATIGFNHPAHVMKAEKLWKSIESSFQSVLGCYVEIKIKLISTCFKKKKKSFSFLSCSGRKQEMSMPNIIDENTNEALILKESVYKRCPLIHDHNLSSHNKQLTAGVMCDKCFFHDKEIVSRNSLSETEQRNIGMVVGQSMQAPDICRSESKSSTAQVDIPYMAIEEAEFTPSCFARILERQKRFISIGASHIICLKICLGGKSEFSLTNKEVDEAYFLAYDRYNNTPSSNTFISCKSMVRKPTKCKSSSRLLCWRPPTSPP